MGIMKLKYQNQNQNKKDIFQNIEMRVKNGVDQEFETSLNEIHKIAKIRLDEII